MTKQEVIAAIKACAEKLGKTPTLSELMKHKGVGMAEVRRNFGSYARARSECKLEKARPRPKIEKEAVFRDWTEVARRLKKVPSIWEYQQEGKYSAWPMKKHFGQWKKVAEGIKLYAEEHGLAQEYADVMVMIEARRRKERGRAERLNREGQEEGLPGQPIYGPLIRVGAIVYGPMNEMGVVGLFCAIAEELGFLILRVQTSFPDCEAMRVVEGGRLKPVKIEFENESRNFLLHKHDPAGCDLIVCWEHNWPESPVEVLELKSAVERLVGKRERCPHCGRAR